MKVLVCGGHLTPALSVIESLPKGTEVLYVGRKYALEGDNAHSLEYQIIQSRGIKFAHINAGKLQRKLTRHTIPALFKLPKGFFEALNIVKAFHPDVVVGFGGYVSVPLGFAAFFLRIPLVIHEQTFAAGLANKLLIPVADKICLSWKSSVAYFPKNKIVLTGNPAVKEIFDTTNKNNIKKKTNLPLLVIVGGSLGSHALNTLTEGVLKQLLEHFEVIHQTGDAKQFNDFDRLEEKKKSFSPEFSKRYTLTKFIDPKEIIATFEAADVVVTRAGVNTITSLLILKKPSLVVPLPSSQKNDQYKNAEFLAEQGLGLVAQQQTLTQERFFELIFDMMKHRDKFSSVKHTEDLAAHQSANKKIVDIIIHYAQKKNQPSQNSQSA